METRKNILLVEDNVAVREALVNALETENYHVFPAGNVREAACEFSNNPIDVALLDLNLGLESGWDVFQKLNSIRPLPSTVVISGERGRFSHPLAASVDALMEKPLNLSALFQKLDLFVSESAESRLRRRKSISSAGDCVVENEV